MTRPTRASAGAWGLAFAIIALLASSPPSGADPGDDAALFAQTAAARAQRGLGPLLRSGDLDAVARRHAQRLAASTGPAFHNPNLQAETPGWQAVGEVVGRITAGPGWDGGLVQLWLNSPAHRQVVLSASFTTIGVGTARAANGVISAVEVLARGQDTPHPPRASRQQPAPLHPRSTSAPTTAPPPTTPPPTTTPTPPPPPTTAPPTTISSSALPQLMIAAGVPGRVSGAAGATAMVSLLACCAGLGHVARGRPKR